jgi:L-aspartate oxidase
MSTLFDTRRYLTEFDSARTGHILTDVLVVGGGIAGARAAIEAASHGDVILITKEKLKESASVYAQGGIASAIDPADSAEAHAEDTMRVAAGLGHADIVKRTVTEGLDRIHELMEWGAQFDKTQGQVDLGQEGGHHHRRILHAHGDATGRELMRCLRAKLRDTSNVRIFEDCFIIDLITLKGRCVGAVTFHPKYGHQLIWAARTIIASGGAGRLWRETTNPPVATGDGFAAAYRAGAKLRDMELMQFHPTVLYVAGASRTLISEAVRGEGAYLVDRNGRRFMQDYHPDGELAPRDIVSQAIRDTLAHTNATSVFIDVRHLGRERFAARFPHITELCEEFDLDVGRDLIPVRPAAHYMIGGILVDADGQTSLDGLLSCGEAASTGLHGANRLASNSLLEGLVYGAVAGRTAGRGLGADGHPVPAKIRSTAPDSRGTRLDLADVRNSLKSLMWRNVGITRSGTLLGEALEIIEFWGRFVLDKTFDDAEGWETQNLLTLGRLVTSGALHRTESRGVHFREDCPAGPNDSADAYHITQQRAGDNLIVERTPLG